MFEPERYKRSRERWQPAMKFYIENEAFWIQQFRDKHDKLACDILGKLFLIARSLVLIDARAISIGAEISHLGTQQIPSGIGK